MTRRWWIIVCCLFVLPLTAILHHAVFFRPTCMLNPFGPDYYPGVIVRWLRADPSLPLAIVAAAVTFAIGLRFSAIRMIVATFCLAFIPLAVWVWDVPLTGRLICHALHDGRAGLHSRHLYLLGFACWPLLLLSQRLVNRRRWSSA